VVEISRIDQETLELLESDLWRPETRHDRQRMDEVFAPDFFEVGRSGRVYDREELLNTDGKPFQAVLPLPNFRAHPITKDVALVTYDSALTRDGAVLYGRRSSLWSRESGIWKLRFHQGTPYSREA
jgi:hypothetical protein